MLLKIRSYLYEIYKKNENYLSSESKIFEKSAFIEHFFSAQFKEVTQHKHMYHLFIYLTLFVCK